MCTAFSHKIQPELMQEIRLLIEESENNVLQELTKAQKAIANKKRRRDEEAIFPIIDVSENVDDVSMEAVVAKKNNQAEEHPQKKQRGGTVSVPPKSHLKFKITDVASAVRKAQEHPKKKASVYEDSDDDDEKDVGGKTKKPEQRPKDGPSTSSAVSDNDLKPSTGNILTDEEYYIITEAFKKARDADRANGGKDNENTEALIDNAEKLVLYLFGSDKRAKFFNKNNVKSMGMHYEPDVKKTVVKHPNALMMTWKEKWDEDTQPLVQKNQALAKELPPFNKLPTSNGISPRKCLFCHFDSDRDHPFARSMAIKKKTRVLSAEHRIAEGLMTFKPDYNFTIYSLISLFHFFGHPKDLPKRCDICRIEYDLLKNGKVDDNAVQKHLGARFHQYAIRYIAGGCISPDKIEKHYQKMVQNFTSYDLAGGAGGAGGAGSSEGAGSSNTMAKKRTHDQSTFPEPHGVKYSSTPKKPQSPKKTKRNTDFEDSDDNDDNVD